jgi:long-chain acyl-CoA synthetase
MKRELRGFKRSRFLLDFNLYRVNVPIQGVAQAELSVVDIHPDGAEKTLMFVHGYAGCAETWEHQINHFALRQGWRVVVPDLRGHGQSDAPYTRYNMDELVHDLYTITQALHLPNTFTLIGHSFGGSVCVEFAVAYPERLEKLILVATAGEFPLPKAVSLLSRVPVAMFRPFWKYRPRWNSEPHVMKRMMLNNLRVWQGWEQMKRISTPTLVITGERDTYFPRRVFEQVGQTIPKAEVLDVGASKHKVQLERHQAVNRAIERFVSENRHTGSWRGQSALGDETQANSLLKRRPWLSHYHPDTPVNVPIPRVPMHKFLESAAAWVPKNTATIFYDKTLNYEELNREVNRFAHALLGLGVQHGERVLLVMPDLPQFIIAYYAILKIGAVVVMPNPDADGLQIAAQAAQTQAKLMVTLLAFGRLAQAVQAHSKVQKVIFADLRESLSSAAYKQLKQRWGERGLVQSEEEEQVTRSVGTLMARLMLDADPSEPRLVVAPEDLACILYTSGTTDSPKGVCLTHANIVSNTLQTRHWIPNLEYGKEVVLSVLPLIHSYGMTNAMNIPIALGATIILQPVFELQQVLENIKRYKPTLFPGVPSMYMALNMAKNVREYGLSSIKACLSGAAPLPVEVQEAFEKLTQGRLVEGYGLTEASPVTHANPLVGERKVGSIGLPIPNTDAKIVDLVTGESLPPNRVGELLIAGPQVMRGYWQADYADESESVIRDGWLYTGDLAVMDEDGFYYLISRKRDTIMAGEYSVYPRDVEEVLYESSKVLEVAVVGVQAEPQGNGQRVKAFVVPRPNTHLTKEELLELCRKRLDEYAVPWEIEFREQLPKSFVGKVLRRMLVEDLSTASKPHDERA